MFYFFLGDCLRVDLNSLEKEYYPSAKDSYVKRYLNFREIPLHLEGTWYILGRVNSTVNDITNVFRWNQNLEFVIFMEYKLFLMCM